MHSNSHIIAGDIGGTKTYIALADISASGTGYMHLRRYESRDFGSLEELIRSFLLEVTVDSSTLAACFGIAGPVKDGMVKTTNLPWIIDGGSLKKNFNFKKLELMNDFKAILYGISCLEDKDMYTLNKGLKETEGPVAVIGAGTGLGEGLALFNSSSGTYNVLASEGGHADFSPKNDEEINLLGYLKKKYDHVSFETVLSGRGLENIYNYLLDSGLAPASYEASKAIASGDPAAAITCLGLNGKDALCEKALDMFVSVYGTEAGNLALKTLPSGGLYIGGGIAPKIIDKLKKGSFMKAFLSKGRLSGFLENIPVHVILNSEVGLMGATVRGRELLNTD